MRFCICCGGGFGTKVLFDHAGGEFVMSRFGSW